MKLQEDYICKGKHIRFCLYLYLSGKNKAAFTLVELLIVMAIFALLITASIPVSINFYKARTLDVNQNGLVQTLRKAQLKAMSIEADSSFGVYITQGKYILFRGSSYKTRDANFDEIFKLPSNIEVSGLSEIVFSKLDGIPSKTGDITLTSGSKSETISINKVGKIDY